MVVVAMVVAWIKGPSMRRVGVFHSLPSFSFFPTLFLFSSIYSAQVDAIGRRTDAEAAQARYEKEIASLKAEAQAQLEAAVHDAVSAKHAAMEGLIAEREAAMDAAYAKHLNDTIAQQTQAQVRRATTAMSAVSKALLQRLVTIRMSSAAIMRMTHQLSAVYT